MFIIQFLKIEINIYYTIVIIKTYKMDYIVKKSPNEISACTNMIYTNIESLFDEIAIVESMYYRIGYFYCSDVGNYVYMNGCQRNYHKVALDNKIVINICHQPLPTIIKLEIEVICRKIKQNIDCILLEKKIKSSFINMPFNNMQEIEFTDELQRVIKIK